LACLTCNFDARPCRLHNGRKGCFTNHHRLLSRNHKFRLAHAHFDGNIEELNPPLNLSGSNIFGQVRNVNVIFGSGAIVHGTKERPKEKPKQWNKRSIFF